MSEELNFEDELRKVLRRDPFHPFSIKLTSGDRYDIKDPQQLAIGANTVVVMHPRQGMSFFRKNQMVAIDAGEPTI